MTACARCSFDPDAQVTASWSFHIPRELGSLNKRVFNGRMGWVYRADRNAWAEDFANMRAVLRIPIAKGKRRVTLTRVYSGRQKEMDLRNIDTKACFDAMTIAGLLVDDNPACLESHVSQERGVDRGVRVLVEEVGA
jgi:Holliday junction resolvase RusA-like endonuclease